MEAKESNQPRQRIEYIDPETIEHSPYQARKHPPKQIASLAKSIDRFGFVGAIVIDEKNQLLAGHGQVEAAKLLDMKAIPAIRVRHLDEAQKRALIIAMNRLAELASWDEDKLRSELRFLAEYDIDFDFSAIGFETGEVDVLLEDRGDCREDDLSQLTGLDQAAVTQPGDLWQLGDHRSYCGDARDPATFQTVLTVDRARAVITDPPYNVRVDGHVRRAGSGHREFAMASGEMSSEVYAEFLSKVLLLLATASVDGALHYIFMDWRHLSEIFAAGRTAYSEIKNLVVWNKMSGGMGSLYRSQHELVLVFKSGTAPHINNINLGAHGRNRTNVWDHPGINVSGRDRKALLAMHPTIKPVALIADIIRDCSARGDIILDPFAGAGTILIAAEKTKRRAAAIELDPRYVDAGIRRWEAYTGQSATHIPSGQTFAQREEALRANLHPASNR